MFEIDAIRKGQLLEDEFFHQLDQDLRAQLRESMEREKLKKQLAAATGFQDEQLLDHLAEAGMQAATVAALALVPTVFIAWADGWVSPAEHQATIRVAQQRGLDHQPPALEMIETWLRKRPPESLWRLWKEYVGAVAGAMSTQMAAKLMQEIHRQATIVAQASGGVFGLGTVSKQEQSLLDEIEALFT